MGKKPQSPKSVSAERSAEELIEQNPKILGATPVIKSMRRNVYMGAGRQRHVRG
jgi:hypothetical protein